jgi:spore coat polysaccharide biosynthesis protein SpsF
LQQAEAGEVVLATTTAPQDEALIETAERLRVRAFRGSTDDVLDRYVGAARMLDVDIIVRATGDNPAVDLDAPARVLRALREHAADYACEDGLPLGAGVEAITTAALVRAAGAATGADDREHVTLYVKRRPGAFRIVRVNPPPALRRPDLRFTIDTHRDLDYMRRLFAAAARPEPTLAELIAATCACAGSDAA